MLKSKEEKDMKKFIFAVLPFVGMASINGMAQSFESEGLYYNIIGEGEAEVAVAPKDAGATYEGVVRIPESVEHEGVAYAVVRIANGAFRDTNVTDVQIPNTVTEIGDSVFDSALRLANVTLPMGITSVPAAMFEKTAIKAVAIPDGVTLVGEGAFQTCESLESVFLPSTLQKIEAYGFNGCQQLREIYCLAATPPEATGWAIFLGLSGIDLLVPEESMDEYGEATPWSDSETFTIYPPESVEISLPASTDHGDWVALPLGMNFAYKIYDGSELIAVTAADSYWVRKPQGKKTYTVVPTNYFYDSPATVYELGMSAVEAVSAETVAVSAANGRIVVFGDAAGEEKRVYGADGRLVYSGTDTSICVPARGIYIVRVAGQTFKVAL